MMTLGEACAAVEALIELEGEETRAALQVYGELVGRRLWNSHEWPERQFDEIVETVAPYETGTATFTEGSANVTGASTVWTAAMEGRWIALTYGGPKYKILTRSSNTAIILDRNYLEDTATASAYVLFQDVLSLPRTLGTLKSIHVHGSPSPMVGVDERRLDNLSFLTGGTDTPRNYAVISRTAGGIMQVRVQPIPNDVLALRVLGLKKWTALSDDADVPPFDDDRVELWIKGMCLWAQHLADARQIITEPQYAALVAEQWEQNKPESPMVAQRATFDAHPVQGSSWDITGLFE